VIGVFLSATIEPGDQPTLTFRYHDSNGKVNFADTLTEQ
jgi:hypothetical protein